MDFIGYWSVWVCPVSWGVDVVTQVSHIHSTVVLVIKIPIDTLSALRANRLLPRCRRTPQLVGRRQSQHACTQSRHYPVEERKAMRSPVKNYNYDIYFGPFRPISLILMLHSVAATARLCATYHFWLSSPLICDWLSQPCEPYHRCPKLLYSTVDELHPG